MTVLEALLHPKYRMSYRGLLVFGTATGLLIAGIITPPLWVGLAGGFLAADTAAKFRPKQDE